MEDTKIPSPFYPEKDSKKILEEVAEYITLRTGRKGVIIVIMEETPCNEIKNGLVCHGHTSEVFQKGIEKDYLPGVFQQLCDSCMKL